MTPKYYNSLDFDPRSPRSNLKLLAGLHDIIRPKTYLEIGIRYGDSLSLSRDDTFALGIDPEPQIRMQLPRRTWISQLTSDAFFRRYGMLAGMLPWGIELALIDGLHLAEYVIRDFINVEKFMARKGILVIDDTNPQHEAWTVREQIEGKWTGDVWKALAIIRRYRPDLVIETFDVHPAGLSIIRGLDPKSRALSDNYSVILDELKSLQFEDDFRCDLANAVKPFSAEALGDMLSA
jgi:hypothetical protein